MDTVEEEDDESPAPANGNGSQNPFSFTNTAQFDFNSGSSSTMPGIIGRPPLDGDTTMTDDPSTSWLSMDLDSLLAQSLPPLDMSLYQSMGDLAPIHSDTVPYGVDDYSSYLFSGIDTNLGSTTPMQQSTSTPLNSINGLQPVATSVTPHVRAILSDFCKSRLYRQL
jgi:hypothetical protein